ncbi:MAG: tetratricopeptide repeat protein [Patescibacteria group bacterium]|jgi:tetratricopeptide (TPR) repeat protein
MIYYIIASAILAIGLGGMAFLTIQKFSQLANIDLENLPSEKELKKKKEMIGKRVAAERHHLLLAFLRRTSPFRKIWGKVQLKFRIYVGKVERLLHHEQRAKDAAEVAVLPTEAVETKLASLIQDGTYNLSEGDFEKAEELFIAAIKIDSKCAPAYRGLGDTYLANSNLEEAEETYQFLLQLQPNDDAAMVKISEMLEKRGDVEEAINYLQQAVILNDSLSSRFFHLTELLLKVNQPDVAKEAIEQAVELEPKNPKYLDLMIETAILCHDKDLAERGFQELRLANPQNNKLEGFQSRINDLS